MDILGFKSLYFRSSPHATSFHVWYGPMQLHIRLSPVSAFLMVMETSGISLWGKISDFMWAHFLLCFMLICANLQWNLVKTSLIKIFTQKEVRIILYQNFCMWLTPSVTEVLNNSSSLPTYPLGIGRCPCQYLWVIWMYK